MKDVVQKSAVTGMMLSLKGDETMVVKVKDDFLSIYMDDNHAHEIMVYIDEWLIIREAINNLLSSHPIWK